MSSSCIEEVSVPNDDWYRIAVELLAVRALKLMVLLPPTCELKTLSFLSAFYRKGRWG